METYERNKGEQRDEAHLKGKNREDKEKRKIKRNIEENC